jgi:phosphatidylglycerophosphatase A
MVNVKTVDEYRHAFSRFLFRQTVLPVIVRSASVYLIMTFRYDSQKKARSQASGTNGCEDPKDLSSDEIIGICLTFVKKKIQISPSSFLITAREN